MGDSIVQNKAFNFAVNAVNFTFDFQNSNKEYIVSRQFLKCSTSICANITEALSSISKKGIYNENVY